MSFGEMPIEMFQFKRERERSEKSRIYAQFDSKKKESSIN